MLDDAEDDDGCLEDEASLNERRLVSRYGVWLLVGLCTPEPDTPMSTFGHMLSMLYQVKYVDRVVAQDLIHRCTRFFFRSIL